MVDESFEMGRRDGGAWRVSLLLRSCAAVLIATALGAAAQT
jgi:hypothetical protein